MAPEAFNDSSSQVAARSGNQIIATAAGVDVPEPASLALVGAALAGVGLARRRRTSHGHDGL